MYHNQPNAFQVVFCDALELLVCHRTLVSLQRLSPCTDALLLFTYFILHCPTGFALDKTRRW